MTTKRKLILKTSLINFAVPLFFGAFLRELMVQLFNPNFERTLAERFSNSFRFSTYAMVLGFCTAVCFIVLRILRPLLRFLDTGERTAEARKAAIGIPWILIGFHMLMWLIGVTAMYALVFRWDSPGGIGYGMSLANSLSTALITGLVSALMMNLSLLPAKDALGMTSIMKGERDLFRRLRDSILILATVVNLGVFGWMMADFYRYAVSVPPLLDSTGAGALLIIVVFGAVFLGMVWLVHKENAWQSRQIRERLADLNAAGGDLSRRITLYNFDDYGFIGHGFNELLGTLAALIGEISTSGDRLKETGGKLSSDIDGISGSVEESMSKLAEVTGNIDEQGRLVSSSDEAVGRIADSIGTLDSRIEEQVSTVAESAAAVEQMIGNFSSVASTLQKTRSLFDALIATAADGGKRIDATVKGIDDVREQARKLDEANALIADIADRTNLLAMNAAIQAAHAGEAGKGFGVVAGEIRSLAENAADRSKDVGEALTATVNLIGIVAEEISVTLSSFRELEEKVRETHDLQQHILESMEEQQIGGREVLEGLSRMKDISAEVKNTAEGVVSDSNAVRDRMKELRDFSERIRANTGEFFEGSKSIQETMEKIAVISEDNAVNIGAIAGKVGRFKT